MANDAHSADEPADRAEPAESQPDEREIRAANLFDVRRIIGGLFLLYGTVLFVLGLGASDQDLRHADGVNVNLAVGITMLVIAALFIAWALWRPLGRELAKQASSGTSGRES